jgi:hypothetical protein
MTGEFAESNVREGGANVRTLAGKIVLIVAFSIVAITAWDRPARAADPALHIMPPVWGGSFYDYGLHYDETSSLFGAYDYSVSLSTASWIRGMAYDNLNYTTRYQYFSTGTCSATGRMWRLINGTWYAIYDRDLHWTHIDTSTAYVKKTSSVTLSGDWFYASDVGAVDDCGLQTGANLHMSGQIGSYLSVAPKSNDTCWSDSSQCNIGTVRKHSTCTTWSGSGSGKSGTAAQYIACDNPDFWPIALRSDGQSVFIAR